MYTNRNNRLEVLKLYTKGYTQEFYLREISRLSKIPLKTTQNIVSFLEEAKLLKSNVRGKNKYFMLNLDNIAVKYSLIEAEVYKTLLFLEEHPLIKSFLKTLQTDSLFLVFGSFAKGTAAKDSDLDLLLVGKEKIPFHLLPYTFHKIELDGPSFLKAVQGQENFIKEVEEHHILLSNHSFYVEMMWRFYGK